MNYRILLLILACTLFSCEKFEYSPHQEKVNGMPVNLNDQNLQRLLASEPMADDTVTIIYSGDSQRYYDRLTDLVSRVNSIPNVDFFIISGDIADFGVKQEYLWICERLEKLNVPYLCAIGNHDMANDNGHLYTEIFGRKNFSFLYKGYKFLFHDTNCREYAFNGYVPDIPWLASELDDKGASWFVGISHVPPYDDDFDKNLEGPYTQLFGSTPHFILSLHGHKHDASDGFPYHDSVRYMTSNSIVKDEVVMLKFYHGRITKTMVAY